MKTHPFFKRFQVLLDEISIDLKWIVVFVGSFPQASQEYLELSLNDYDASLGIMVRGRGVDFTNRVARFMAHCGVVESRLQHFLSTAHQLNHRKLFFKIELSHTGITEVTWYFQQKLSLQRAITWLQENGIDDDDFVHQVANALKKPTVHFLAQSHPLGEEPGSPVTRLYFTQTADPRQWRRLRPTAELCGVSREWGVFQAHTRYLAGHDYFLSIGWVDGQREGGMKLDIHGLRVSAITRIAAENEAEGTNRLHKLLALQENITPDYVGFRLIPNQRLRTKLYIQ